MFIDQHQRGLLFSLFFGTTFGRALLTLALDATSTATA
jgi:hypothetical protein